MKYPGPQFVLASILLACSALSAQAPGGQIPPARLESFSGETITLPGALYGKVGILVLGFSQGSRQAVTEWGRRLAADYRDSPTVLYYEMPVLAAVPRLVRGLVLREMRSAVPAPAWPRFVPVTEDEKAWRGITRYAAADDAYVLLVDGQGAVRWQTSGSATDAAFAALKQHVRMAGLQTATTQPH